MKNKLFAVILTAAVLLCSLSFPSYAEESLPSYLALGDSITTGYGLSMAEEQAFASLVASDGGFNLHNEGIDGNTSARLLADLKAGRYDAQLRTADLITVTCGGNDMVNVLYEEIAYAYNQKYATAYTHRDITMALAGMHSTLKATDCLSVGMGVLGNFTQTTLFQTALGTYEENMFGSQGVIAYMRAINSDAELIVCTQYNPYRLFSGLLWIINRTMEDGAILLNEVIEKNAASCGYTVADVYTAFEGIEENLCNCVDTLSDLNLDFHPNRQGHTVIANTIREARQKARLGLLGYQLGASGVRFVGYVNTLYYDRLELQITVTDALGQTLVRRAEIDYVCETVVGTVNGERRVLLSTNAAVTARQNVDHAYLFVCPLTELAAGSYRVTLQPIGYLDRCAYYAKECSLALEVSEDGTYRVITQEEA